MRRTPNVWVHGPLVTSGVASRSTFSSILNCIQGGFSGLVGLPCPSVLLHISITLTHTHTFNESGKHIH